MVPFMLIYSQVDDAKFKILGNNGFVLILTVSGLKVAPDPGVHRNEGRRDFCKKYDGYPEFCDGKFF